MFGISRKNPEELGSGWRWWSVNVGLLALIGLLAAVLVACGDDDEPDPTPAAPAAPPAAATASPEAEPSTIVEIAVGDGRFGTLVAALEAADLVDALSGEGPFTVFAPTDDAFAALPEGTVEALLEDIPALTDILLYHVVSGDVKAADVVTLEAAETLQGGSLTITVEGDMVRINDAQVVIADIEASNGTIHVIDAVLLPPAPEETAAEPTEAPAEEPAAEQPGTIVDIAVADGRFTTLVTAVQAAGLVDALAGEGPLTVFAPTDDAFAALPEGTVEALLEDIPALTDILLSHVVSGDVKAADVVTLESAETLQGSLLTISVEGDVVRINGAQVVIADIEASNGTIHVIDAVLLPPEAEAPAEAEARGTIVDIAVADGRFTTLVAAVQAAGLVEALAGEGPLTVFAPTDDAFAALPEGTVEALLEDIPALTDILLYHVVAGDVKAADVVTLESAETLQGGSLTITVEGDVVRINGAQVVIVDIEASNGTIHVIDTVLLPPAE